MPISVVRGERIVLPDGIRPAAIYIRDGFVHAVRPHGDVPAGVDLLDAGTHVVLPGLVDTHVHINDPGRAEWEGFDTRRAPRLPVVSRRSWTCRSTAIPSTTTVAALTAKRAAIAGDAMSTSGSGAGLFPATRRRSSRSRAPACAASSAFSVRRASTSSRTSPSGTFAKAMPVAGPARRAAAGARRGPGSPAVA